MDLFVVPTIGFKRLYGFVIVRIDRRDLVKLRRYRLSGQHERGIGATCREGTTGHQPTSLDHLVSAGKQRGRHGASLF